MFAKLSSNEYFCQAAAAQNYRDAERAFACWLNSPDPGAALVVADTMTPMQARRIGFGLAVAQVSNLLPPSPDGALLVKKLREKAGVDARPTLKESWQPDFAFETEMLKQRTREIKRLSTVD